MPPDNYNLLIISAGRYGRELHCQAMDNIEAGAPWKIKGFLDDRADILNDFEYDTPVLSNVEDYEPLEGDRFLCAIGDLALRKHYCEMIMRRGGIFINCIHPTTITASTARFGTGVVVGPNVVIGADAFIGDFSMIGPSSFIGHDCSIGSWSNLSGVCCLGGKVTLGEYCFVGLHATIVPDVVVQERVFIGAGSVVLHDIPGATKVFGNPAVSIGSVEITPPPASETPETSSPW